jgi:3-deoxy-7-phosphoheptulonate synthase
MPATTPLRCSGLRGATTVKENTREQILEATRELLTTLITRNQIDIDDITSIFFTVTEDLDAEHPALAARQLGWNDLALLCSREIPVPGSLPSCIRVLLHVNTGKSPSELRHVYLREAASLRPGWADQAPSRDQTCRLPEPTRQVTSPYKLASREGHPLASVVNIDSPGGNVLLGGDNIVIMAGPCAVESEEQLLAAARAARDGGASVLRGGAYKPSTSPYSFRGLGVPGLKLLAEARADTGLAIVTEVMTPADVDLVSEYCDILQIGARNMQNYCLLDEVGSTRKPVLLKRGLSATVEEWLLAAEYVLARGNPNVILCERGIRTFETLTRNTVDINAVPLVKQLSHLPIIVDPSQGTGRRSLVEAVSLAAVAAGADGLIIEIHPHPDEALKDGAQSLPLDAFSAMVPRVAAVAAAVGRRLTSPAEVPQERLACATR